MVTVLHRFKLESWTCLLVSHLSFCDILICLVGSPFWIAGHTSTNFTVCLAGISISCIPTLASSWTLILIAYDRYVFIKYPLRYSLIITTKKMVLSMCLIWLFAVVFAIFVATVGFNRPTDGNCFISLVVNKWLIATIVFIFTVLPITLMFILYRNILQNALRQQRRPEEFTDKNNQHKRAAKLRKERKTIRMLYSIVIVYVLCVLPYSAVGSVDLVNPSIIKIDVRNYFEYLSIMLFVNAVTNPILYTMMNKDIRKAVLCQRNVIADIVGSTRQTGKANRLQLQPGS